MKLLNAVVLGAVEGITEFLPVSSTGHMILTSHLLGLSQGEFEKTFEVAIQLGAILCVVVLYRNRLKRDMELWKKLITAFIPTGIAGLTLHSLIEQLFSPVVVVFALAGWGVVFIAVELLLKGKPVVTDPAKLSYKRAVLIGLFQSLAMVPGTSRSGATIVGGLLAGMSRKTATEFSFLLAIPTMLSATAFEVVKNSGALHREGITALLVGSATAFAFALVSVKWLLGFVSRHTFIPFGIYRILVSLLFALHMLNS